MPSPIALYHNVVDRLKRTPDGLMVFMARVGMGAFFVRAGQTKVDGDFNLTSSALYLFKEEYKVPVLPPEVAAYMAAGVEHIAGGLLVIGLATRLSAATLFGMTVVIQVFVYPGSWPDHVLWMAALLLVLSRGPGWLAADSLVCRLSGTCGSDAPSGTPKT